MSSVLLVTASVDVTRRVRLASDDDLTVLRPEQLPATAPQLLALLPEPDALRTVLLDTSDSLDPARALETAKRLDERYPHLVVFLVTADAEPLALPAIRAGVRDLIDVDCPMEELRVVLRRAHAVAQPPTSEADGGPTGRVIAVASPKGGVGKTTVATNLAAGLAQHAPQGTVLIDLDVQFGDVAAALDLEPTYTLADVVGGRAVDDPILLKSLLTRHENGLQVLCGVTSPAEADAITPQKIDQLLQLLQREFRYVVVDTAPGMNEHTMAVIDRTTDLVLVTGLDVPGVRGLRKELQILDELELQPSTRHIIVNFEDSSAGLNVKDVEAAIGRPVDYVLPRSPKVHRSTNQGTPIIEWLPKDKVSRALVQLVERFAHIAAGTRRSTRRQGGTG